MKWLAAIIVFMVLGCQNAAEGPETVDGSCHVVRFSAPGEAPVCAIRCTWDRGIGNSRVGYSDTTPVPCSWHGKKPSQD